MFLWIDAPALFCLCMFTYNIVDLSRRSSCIGYGVLAPLRLRSHRNLTANSNPHNPFVMRTESTVR